MYPFLKASNDNLVIGSNMKEINIKVSNISQKQWSNLVLELNLIKKSWERYAKLDLQGPGIKKIIAHGTRNFDTKED